MHTPLDPHLHSEECNKAINNLIQCHAENSKWVQMFGVCDEFDRIMRKCMKQERIARQKANHADALRRREERARKMQALKAQGKTIEDKIREDIEKMKSQS